MQILYKLALPPSIYLVNDKNMTMKGLKCLFLKTKQVTIIIDHFDLLIKHLGLSFKTSTFINK